ncbi:acyltransferase [Microbacterium sp. NPDC055521]
MRDLMLLVIWLLPASRTKNRLLTLCGHRISREASARSNLVWKVRSFEMAPHARINRWNLIKGMKTVRLAPYATIGRNNIISAHASYGQLPGGAGLELGPHSYVTSRHSIDCSGSLTLGAFSALAGFGSQVLTHSIDLTRDAQTAYPVVIGERSFVGARCLLLGGSSLPSRSVLAAGSVLTDAARSEQGLWAGVPARFKTEVDGQWFDRTVGETLDLYIPEHDRTVASGI